LNQRPDMIARADIAATRQRFFPPGLEPCDVFEIVFNVVVFIKNLVF